jgi:glycine cleavage system T protein
MAELDRSPLADHHASQRATLGTYHGATVPARFTDPASEHLTVRNATGIFDFSFRAHFAVTGDDRARFLQRIISNDVKSLAPGQGTYATLLTAQGHILADFQVFAGEDRFMLATDADLAEKLAKGLGRYIIADRVKIERMELFAIAFQGPQSRPLVSKTLHVDIPDLAEYGHFGTNYAGFPVRVVRASSTGEEGYEVWVGAKGMMGVWGAACGQAPTYGTLPCGFEALESLRIEAGIPRYGAELDEETMIHEAGLLNAVSFTKGCYVGQEIVERTRTRGHVNWRLVGLIVESPTPASPGEKLLAGGQEVGEVTSSCISPTLAKTIALGYLRREAAEPGTRISLASGASASVTALPFYSTTSASQK